MRTNYIIHILLCCILVYVIILITGYHTKTNNTEETTVQYIIQEHDGIITFTENALIEEFVQRKDANASLILQKTDLSRIEIKIRDDGLFSLTKTFDNTVSQVNYQNLQCIANPGNSGQIVWFLSNCDVDWGLLCRELCLISELCQNIEFLALTEPIIADYKNPLIISKSGEIISTLSPFLK